MDLAKGLKEHIDFMRDHYVFSVKEYKIIEDNDGRIVLIKKNKGDVEDGNR